MHQGHGSGPRAGAGPLPAVDTAVEDTDRGARILLTPKDPADLELLRQRARWHAERMGQRECWQGESNAEPPAAAASD